MNICSPHKELADILCEFFEVAIHSVLFVRGVYPSNLFERKKKYNVPVHISRCQELNVYIWEIVNSISSFIEKGIMDKLVVCIIDNKRQPLERYVFETSFQQKVKRDKLNLAQVEAVLRAFLLRICTSDTSLPVHPDCSFEVVVYTTEDTVSSYWTPVDGKKTELTNPSLVPIKSVNSDDDPFTLQLFVEKVP